MKNGLRCLVVVLMAVMVISGGAFAAEKTLINGIDANYPPYSFIDKTGKPDGLDVMAVNWIAKEMGFKVKHQPTEWAAIIPSLKAKKIDFIASGMSVTPERKEQVNFTVSYYQTVMVLVAKDISALTVDQAINGNLKWGVQRGTSEAKWIEDNLLKKGKAFKLQQYDSAPLAMEDILNGRIDVAAVSTTSAEEFMLKGMAIRIIGKYGQPDDETAYAVRKEDTELYNKLNDGLKKLMATPYWQELKHQYGLR